MRVRVLVGDCIARLRELPADSVHCCVTSPPYWGLRDYGVEGQIGLEPTPEAWAARLVEVFREVRRVLRPDGVCFVNVGDSYAQNSQRRDDAEAAYGAEYRAKTAEVRNDKAGSYVAPTGWGARGDRCARSAVNGLKPKDLVGQPWLLAFALRADGWWLRSDIQWAKPNPMPESVSGWAWVPHRVRDEDGKLVECPGCPKCEPNDGLVLDRGSWRPTKAHEVVFMLAKSDRYFCDGEAVREPHSEMTVGTSQRQRMLAEGKASRAAEFYGALTGSKGNVGERMLSFNPAGRNLRSVWTIATEPFPEAHFATFPTELPRRCILAGTSAKGCCQQCGAPWARVVETRFEPQSDVGLQLGVRGHDGQKPMVNGNGWQGVPRGSTRAETTGWRATCVCDAGDPVPATILDPFGGSGTTGLVADQLGRHAILIELSPEYAAIAERRIRSERARRAIGHAELRIEMPGQLSLLDGVP